MITFVALTSIGYYNKIFSFRFVDEEDNFTLGKYLIQGDKIYSDLFSHHQPFAYIMSASIQKVASPDNIYMLVKRHREFMILWSIIWVIFLFVRFGKPLIPFVLIYETVKIFLLGHLFISEALAVYPLVYLLSYLFLTEKKSKGFEFVFFGFFFSLVTFLLAPIWPALGVIFILFLLKDNFTKLKFIYFTLGFLPIFLTSLYFSSIKDYLYFVFYVNQKYYLPVASAGSFPVMVLSSFITPLIALTSQAANSPILIVCKIASAALIVNIIILVKTRQYKIVFLLLLILGTSNIRFVDPGLQEYTGFHFTPYFGLLVASVGISSKFALDKASRKIKIVLLLLGLIMMIFLGRYFFEKTYFTVDKEHQYYIHYSEQYDFGEAVKIMKADNDKLFVAPDEWLVYWQGDVGHASFMVNYYAWMTTVPYIKDSVESTFRENPPQFFYCDCQGSYFGLEHYFDKYIVLKRYGQPSKLRILKEKYYNLSSEQKNKLRFYGFEL